ncbi:MAG TPA: Gldg family protein, partial [Spirochaetia bacterium]|nr:Gldg family protein [Spirochaetia bacterium]
PVPAEIRDILTEYANVSHGKVDLRVVSADSSGVVQELQSLGIAPQQMNIVNASERTTAAVYSAIDIEYLNRHVELPFVVSTQDLEYSLTSKITQVVAGGTWAVGVLVGDSNRSLAADYTLVQDGVGRYYQVLPIQPGAAISPSLAALIVLGGQSLTMADLQPIDRFLMQGGRILFCVPGVSIDTAGNLSATALGDLPIFKLISSYGVQIGHSLVLDSMNKDFRTLEQNGGQYVWRDFGPYPHWISVEPQNVTGKSPITRNFLGLDLLWPSPLTELPRPGEQFVPLVKSSSNSWLMRGQFDTSPSNIAAFSSPPEDVPVAQYTLGYAVSGAFPSFFDSSGTSSAHKLVSPDTRIVVFGDEDFVSNLVHYSNSAYNVQFLENVVDWLAGNDGLLAIKTKAQWDPRLDKIGDPAAKQRVYGFAQLVSVGLVPAIVLLVGLRRLRKRTRRAGALGGDHER